MEQEREKERVGETEGGCQVGVFGIWSMFGLEGKAPALDSQEDNGKEKQKKGRFMDVCVCVCVYVCAPSQVVDTFSINSWYLLG